MPNHPPSWVSAVIQNSGPTQNRFSLISAATLTSGIFGNKLSINAATIKSLEEKFGREKLEQFLNEFNTAGRIEALTEKEGRFILRQLSLNSLRNRILTDAQEADISPSAWQVQTSFSRLASEADPSASTPPQAPPSQKASKSLAECQKADRFLSQPKVTALVTALVTAIQVVGQALESSLFARPTEPSARHSVGSRSTTPPRWMVQNWTIIPCLG